MKILSLLLMLTLTLNSFAATGALPELERLIDDYHYTVSVEWDQKDQAAYKELNLAFIKRAKEVLAQNSLTQEEILQLAERRLGGKKEFETLKLKLNLRKAPASDEETIAIVQEISKDFYQKGASWNGDVVMGISIVAGLIIVSMVILHLMELKADYICVELGPRYKVCEWGYGENNSLDWGHHCWYEQDCVRSEPNPKKAR